MPLFTRITADPENWASGSIFFAVPSCSQLVQTHFCADTKEKLIIAGWQSREVGHLLP